MDRDTSAEIETTTTETASESTEITEVESTETEVESETEAEESTEEKATETDETVTDEIQVESEPLTFDAAEELPALLEKTTPILEKYELPQEVKAVIDVLRTKAETAPADILGEYSVYGEMDDVKGLLTRQSLLDSHKTDDSGTIRPKTDEFVADVIAKSPDTASWLHYDLSQSPSTKYEGKNRFEELVIESLALPNDTVRSVTDRYEKFMGYMKAGALPANDIPAFVPENLYAAYSQLPRQTREELAALDENFDDDKPSISQKLAELALIQKGIDADGRESQFLAERERQSAIQFNEAVLNTQNTFFDAFRNTFTQDLIKNVKFSDDPKIQSMIAHQNVTLLSQAFDDGSAGEFARKALTDAGITFDSHRAAQILRDVETASAALVLAQRQIDPKTKEPLDRVALNKATKDFENTTRKMQALGKETIDQLARLTATGTAEAVQKAVEKIRIAPKARPATKGVASAATNKEVLPKYGTDEWDKYWAAKTIEEQAARAKAYA